MVTNQTATMDTWRGVYPAICTPSTEDDAVDVEAQRRVVRFALDGGAHGIVAFGLAGEVLNSRPTSGGCWRRRSSTRSAAPSRCSSGSASQRARLDRARAPRGGRRRELRRRARADERLLSTRRRSSTTSSASLPPLACR